MHATTVHRALLLAVLLTLAGRAAAGWHPQFVDNRLVVEVGETKTVRAYGAWSGTWGVWWENWYVYSSDPDVAHIETTMYGPAMTDIPVTGIRPGRTTARVRGMGFHDYMKIDVVCGTESVIENATPEVRSILGEAVTLRVETPIAHRTAFTWYRGHNGDTSNPIAGAAGLELVLTPESKGTQYVWVLATTPCSRSAAEFRIDAHVPKQRASRR